MSYHFPEDLKRFVAQHVESLAQLETLLLVRRDRGREWPCDELSRQLYIGSEMCDAIVVDLVRRGFVERAGDKNAYRYGAQDEMDRLLGELAALYEERPVAVITEIYSKPVNKVQTFADAFRLRREE